MALKFLNKKGWHTGSLRNIEIVWKAEQKHEAEKRKLEELKKQIHEEREAQEFRHLQEQAGLVPKQERLEFLYDSGLAVGRSSTDDYLLGKPLEEIKGEDDISKVAATPGALFVEERPHSANDAWRKLHSDPLLLIRQQEQAALMRIKNNPIKMDMIKKSVEEKIVSKGKRKQKDERVKNHKEKRKKKKHTSDPCKSNEPKVPAYNDTDKKSKENRKAEMPEDRWSLEARNANDISSGKKYLPEGQGYRRTHGYPGSPKKRLHSPERKHDSEERRPGKLNKRHDSPSTFNTSRVSTSTDAELKMGRMTGATNEKESHSCQMEENAKTSKQQRRKLTDEERAARLEEMQKDANIHEEQRWHRLKKAFDADQLEARKPSLGTGRNFVNETARSIYGAAKGGSNSVEESVRRRTHFIERSRIDSDSNTFQR